MRRMRCLCVFECAQDGMTLIELMIAMALGLFVMLSLIGMLLAGKASYLVQEQQAHIQETGRYALEVLSRAIRQAGHENWHDWRNPVLVSSHAVASIAGFDARTLKRNAPLHETESAGAVNGSDVLMLGFAGVGAAQGAMLNCAGFSQEPSGMAAAAEEPRTWSAFFVARDAAGEPELRCKYQTANGWGADAIARGVESFQVLYGVEIDGEALRFMNAATLHVLDDEAMAASEPVRTYWKRVRAIRISLLIRGEQKLTEIAGNGHHDLFGVDYSSLHAQSDQGVHINEPSLPVASRYRMRHVFTQTIQLRNFGGNAT